MHFPDFEPWDEEEAARACVWDAGIPAEEAQEALKLILSVCDVSPYGTN